LFARSPGAKQADVLRVRPQSHVCGRIAPAHVESGRMHAIRIF
jgi:hypothetical protein